MYVVNYDFQPARKPTPCDAKSTTQLAALSAQLLTRQQARNSASRKTLRVPHSRRNAHRHSKDRSNKSGETWPDVRERGKNT